MEKSPRFIPLTVQTGCYDIVVVGGVITGYLMRHRAEASCQSYRAPKDCIDGERLTP